jgi:hypothetical protein
MQKTDPFRAGYLRERNTNDFKELMIDVLELAIGRRNTEHSRQSFEQLTNMRLNFAIVSEQARIPLLARRARHGFDRLYDVRVTFHNGLSGN